MNMPSSGILHLISEAAGTKFPEPLNSFEHLPLFYLPACSFAPLGPDISEKHPLRMFPVSGHKLLLDQRFDGYEAGRHFEDDL